MNKKISVRAILIIMDPMFLLKVFLINKSKDTRHKPVVAHFRLQSFSLDLIPCFGPNFVDFQNEAVSL